MEVYRGPDSFMMPTELILSERPNNTDLAPLAVIADRADKFAKQAKAKNTIKAYRSDWCHFDSWCRTHGQSSLPATPEILALYVSDLSATHKTATITRRISAISQAHQIAELESPTAAARVRLVMAGIRRNKGTAQTAKTPVLVEDLRRMANGGAPIRFYRGWACRQHHPAPPHKSPVLFAGCERRPHSPRLGRSVCLETHGSLVRWSA